MQYLLIFVLTTITYINAQNNLQPMSRCLHNCAVCSNNQLTTCSGQQMSECVKGYTGSNCNARQIYTNQLILVDSLKNILPVGIWQNSQLTSCSYQNSKLQKIPIYAIGLYTGIQQIIANINIQQNYQNFILNFNLIRSSWTPYRDLLRIIIVDQNQNQIGQNFIQFMSRNQINVDVNLLRCKNNTARIIQKYQIQGEINVGKQSKLVVKFQGDVNSNSDWGLTNVRVLFGCARFLLNDKGECSKCRDGYYVFKANQTILGCEPCPLNCTKCTSNLTCEACSDGYTLQNKKCVNNNSLIIYPAPGRSLLCSNQRIYLLSQTVGTQQKLNITLTSLPTHKQLRLIFYLAYNPDNFNASTKISAQIQGIQWFQINGSKLIGSQSLAKDNCIGFGAKGYHTLIKIITPFIDHNKDKISLVFMAEGGKKLGVFNIGFQSDYISTPQKNMTNTSNQTSPSNNASSSTNPTNSTPVNTPNTTNSSSSQISPIFPQSPTNTTNTTANTNTNQSISNSSSQTIKNNTTNQTNQTVIPPTKPENNTNHTNQNTNNTNSTNSTNNSNSINSTNSQTQSNFVPIIKNIMNVKNQIYFGIKQTNKLIITIHYPIVIDKYPYITVYFNHLNITQIPQITIQTPQYQQLTLHLTQSLLNQKLSIILTSQNPILVARRNLQSSAPTSNQTIGQLTLTRYDHIPQNQWQSITLYSKFFQIISWLIIVTTIIFSFFGNSVIFQQCSILLQIIFLHVYIFTQYLPVNFIHVIGGLYRMQNLNYLTKQINNSIQQFLLGNMTQYSPTKFSIWKKDINFSRAVYPTVIITLLYLLFFIILNIIRKCLQNNLTVNQLQQQRTCCQKLKLFLIRTSQRFINFWYQIWQYQYIVWIWSACLQMYNLSYPQQYKNKQVINMIFCCCAILVLLILPVATVLYLGKRYFRLDYFQYCYWYQGLFYMRLPDQSLPSNHHRIYIIIRNIRYILLIVCFAFVGSYPIQALTIIIIIHVFNLLYLKLAHLEIKSKLEYMHIVQHVLLIGLAVVVIVAYSTSHVLKTEQYMIIGHFMTTICLLLTMLGFIRIGYFIYCKMSQRLVQKQISQFKPAIGTERVV